MLGFGCFVNFTQQRSHAVDFTRLPMSSDKSHSIPHKFWPGQPVLQSGMLNHSLSWI